TTNKTMAPVPPASPIVDCPAAVDLSAAGAGTVTIRGIAPGCCMLTFVGPGEDDNSSEHFACVRVLPLDDYSQAPDSDLNFAFIYREVLQYYHLLHPAMDAVVDLSDETAVTNAVSVMRIRL